MMGKRQICGFTMALLIPLRGFAHVSLPMPLSASPQAPVAIVSRTQAIPKGFKTYSLFLICNPLWLDPAKNDGLLQLYRQFESFGRSIGDDQAAVWFWNSNSYSLKDAALANVVDVERSVHFCQAWHLVPSEGPHLVITSSYPDESNLSSGLPKDSAVYKLGDMPPTAISNLLGKLTDSLVDTGKANAPDTLWVRLLTATQQTINGFGCAWNLKINAGPVSADLKSCSTH